MIACKECSTLNSLDSAFCKSCGKPLPAEEAMDAREHLEKKLDEGFELFHHGRTDEAALIAETSLTSDPKNLRALSLKAMVLERRGMISEALEAYEAIVQRDPSAALERMKVQTLRSAIQQRYLSAPGEDKRMRAIIAAGAAILVICMGAIAALLSSRQQVQRVAKADPISNVTMDTFAPASGTQAADSKGGTATAKEDQPESSSSPQTEQNPQSKLDQTVPANALLPKPSSSDDAGELKPINPLTGAEIQPLNSNQASPPVVKPDTQPKTDPEPSEVSARKTEPAGPPPLVDIQLSDPSQSNANEGAIDKNGIEALVRTARGQYQVGNYQAAATSYEKALRSGADPAMVNQRLGQCYDKLGRTSDATAAYNKAITAIQNAINSGRGNKQLLLAALESSKQALQNLQGG